MEDPEAQMLTMLKVKLGGLTAAPRKLKGPAKGQVPWELGGYPMVKIDTENGVIFSMKNGDLPYLC